MLLIVYARTSLRDYITDVEAETVPTGVMGVMVSIISVNEYCNMTSFVVAKGDKGGVAIRFNIYHSSMCFVNCQLAPYMEDVIKRNQVSTCICIYARVIVNILSLFI